MRQHASQAVKETRCLAELGERGLTAWVLRRLEETDEVEHINGRLERSNAIHRLPQPPQPAPGDSLRLLCAAALSERSTAPSDSPPPSLPHEAPHDLTCEPAAAPTLPLEANQMWPAGHSEDADMVCARSPVDFFEGVFASGAGFGAELMQKGANRLRQTGFRTPYDAARERARWLKSLEQSAASDSAASVQAKHATANQAGAKFDAEGTSHSFGPINPLGKLGINLSQKLSLMHGQLEGRKKMLELASRRTSTWVAPSKHKAASPHASPTVGVASLTTSQLLAASRGVPAPAPLPAPSTTGPLRPGPSPQHRATNLMLPGIEALLPPAPHNKGAQLTSTRDLIEREVSRALPNLNP